MKSCFQGGDKEAKRVCVYEGSRKKGHDQVNREMLRGRQLELTTLGGTKYSKYRYVGSRENGDAAWGSSEGKLSKRKVLLKVQGACMSDLPFYYEQEVIWSCKDPSDFTHSTRLVQEKGSCFCTLSAPTQVLPPASKAWTMKMLAVVSRN
uniref:Uncharacterized protein n=1 Tax=Crocodylus porosus TaxID=8502 RepID=A0A7M4E567_CROPO